MASFSRKRKRIFLIRGVGVLCLVAAQNLSCAWKAAQSLLMFSSTAAVVRAVKRTEHPQEPKSDLFAAVWHFGTANDNVRVRARGGGPCASIRF